jgi:hypothetical protein
LARFRGWHHSPQFGFDVQPSVAALQRQHIDAVDLDAPVVAASVWNIIEQLDIVENRSLVVSGTKTLHHLLPDLVPPMDRANTQLLFQWSTAKFQKRQREFFELAFVVFADVARRVDPQRYVGTNPWHTSKSKVLDNAVVGLISSFKDEAHRR